MKTWWWILPFMLSLPAWAQNAALLRDDTLRAEPFSDAMPVARASAGEIVRVLERKGTWASVDAKGRRGWVRALNLKSDAALPRAEGVAALQTGREAQGGVSVPLAIRGEARPGLALLLLEDLFVKRDKTRAVKLAARQRPGGEMQLELQSARAGYAYVFRVDAASEAVQCLFPNLAQPDNEIAAGEQLVLPREGWRIDASARGGKTTLLALVADAPLDLLLPDKQAEGPWFRVAVNRDNLDPLAAALSGGCTTRQACSAYGAGSTMIEFKR